MIGLSNGMSPDVDVVSGTSLLVTELGPPGGTAGPRSSHREDGDEQPAVRDAALAEASCM